MYNLNVVSAGGTEIPILLIDVLPLKRRIRTIAPKSDAIGYRILPRKGCDREIIMWSS